MKNYNSSLIAEAAIKFPLKSRRRTIKRLYLESLLNSLVREMWQRRKKGHLHVISKKLNTKKFLCNKVITQYHNQALNNDLFLDVEYYMQNTEMSITIVILQSETHQ